MGYTLQRSKNGYTYAYWRLAHIGAIRRGQVVEVTAVLALYKDKAAADAHLGNVDALYYTFDIDFLTWANKTGRQQWRWVYLQINAVDSELAATSDDTE
jgi:hypothetical protein